MATGLVVRSAYMYIHSYKVCVVSRSHIGESESWRKAEMDWIHQYNDLDGVYDSA